MTLLRFEIKKYLLSYKSYLVWLASAALTCFILYKGAEILIERDSFFEPFSIGVVGADASPEVLFVFDFFDGIIGLEYLEKSEAEEMLAGGAIPAYIELPDTFAADVMNGANTPFTFHGSGEYPLRLAISKILAAGGVAFLSSAQAGIYATLDYAAENGLEWRVIESRILLPINIAFIKILLEFNSLFRVENLPLTGGGDPLFFFVVAFAAFMIMTGLLASVKIFGGYSPAVYARFRLAGHSAFKICAVRFLGFFIIFGTALSGLSAVSAHFSGWMGTYEAAARGAAFAACAGSFGMLSASFFKKEAACGLFIFIASLCMYGVSGGAVPLSLMPRGLHALRFASIPYWAAEPSISGTYALLAFAIIFFGVSCVVEIFYKNFLRAA